MKHYQRVQRRHGLGQKETSSENTSLTALKGVGQKTAEKLNAIGVTLNNIASFAPSYLVEKLEMVGLTEDKVQTWQNEARAMRHG